MSGVTDPEVSILLRLLSGREGSGRIQGNFDRQRLVALARMHKVSHRLLVYARKHPGFLSPEHTETLETCSKRNALRALTQLQELIRIAIKLKEQNISFAVIKGPQLSRMIYGREALKESTDLDIMLVKQEDFSRVDRILKDLGYSPSGNHDFRTVFGKGFLLTAKREVVYSSSESRCLVDLHLRPGANTYLTKGLFVDFFADLAEMELEGISIPVLPDEKYLAYLCYHGALHQFSRLTWLLDIRAFLVAKHEVLDFGKILAIARKLHATESLSLAMLLLESYFGDEVQEQLKDHIIRTGRLRWLQSACIRTLGHDQQYALSFRGRRERFIYMLVLLKGPEAKCDFLFGVLVRNLLPVLRWCGL